MVFFILQVFAYIFLNNYIVFLKNCIAQRLGHVIEFVALLHLYVGLIRIYT